MNKSIEIGARFNGPPGSGNGGYSAGLFAALIDAPAVRVRLTAPPPLERKLAVYPDDGGLRIADGEQTIARVWPHEPLEQSPPSPGLQAARRAAGNKLRAEDHPYPGCFVCGPGRAEGDGLRLFSGALGDGQVAGVLNVPADLARGAQLPAAICWAALDCPGAFTFELPPDQSMLLGELTAQMHAPAPAGQPLVVAGRHLGQSGRRHSVATALFSEAGQCIASARATWILVPRSPAAQAKPPEAPN